MNKKYIIILISIVFCFNNILSQSERYYYFYTPEQIEYNIKNNWHEVCNVFYIDEAESTFGYGKIMEFYEKTEYPSVFNLISFGKVRYNNNIIFCYDKRLNRTYKFKQIDKYVVEVLNHTAVFVKGTKLYLHYQEDEKAKSYSAFYKINDLIKSDYWKTGIKNGVFKIIRPPETTLIYYENDIVVDSVRYNHHDSTRFAMKNQFLQRYYYPESYE